MSYASKSAVEDIRFETSAIETMSKAEICSRIRDIGVVPALRANSTEDALFVADALVQAGVPILELAVNAPGAVHILAQVAKRAPKMIVGGGSITTVATARNCRTQGRLRLCESGSMRRRGRPRLHSILEERHARSAADRRRRRNATIGAQHRFSGGHSAGCWHRADTR